MTPIEQIKAAIRLDEYAARYLVIKNKKARCPFHEEKTASLSLHNDYAKCFGCNWSGDLIAFASAYHGISTGGAIRMLASELGIPLTRQPQPHPYNAAKARRERAEAEEWKRQMRRSAMTAMQQDDWDRIEPFLNRIDAAPALTAYRAQRTPEQAVMLRESIRKTEFWVKAITPVLSGYLDFLASLPDEQFWMHGERNW